VQRPQDFIVDSHLTGCVLRHRQKEQSIVTPEERRSPVEVASGADFILDCLTKDRQLGTHIESAQYGVFAIFTDTPAQRVLRRQKRGFVGFLLSYQPDMVKNIRTR
jgi:hypothetical protein